MKKNYSRTLLCSYIGYVTQAICVNLTPLLFAIFSKRYSIDITRLTILITFEFVVQMFIDISGDPIIKFLGYKKCFAISQTFSLIGLLLLGILPFIINPYLAIIISLFSQAIGAGLSEIVLSPLVDALPSDSKSTRLSFLHSFYCWGHLAVILLSTLFLWLLPNKFWYYLPLIWAIIPIINLILFIPADVVEIEKTAPSYKGVVKSNSFVLLFIMIICAGAIEQSVAQWASYFTEITLGLTKAKGDLFGVCGFALIMAICRTLYGLKGKNLNIPLVIICCTVFAGIGITLTCLSKLSSLSLVGITVSGLGVGVLWPIILAYAEITNKNSGTALFSLLALGGDIGCLLGPSTVGYVGGNNLKKGLSFTIIFVILLLVSVTFVEKKSKKLN